MTKKIVLTEEQRRLAADNFPLARDTAYHFCRKRNCFRFLDDMVGVCGLTITRCAVYFQEHVGRNGESVSFSGYFCGAAWKEMTRELRRQAANGFSKLDQLMQEEKSIVVPEGCPRVKRFPADDSPELGAAFVMDFDDRDEFEALVSLTKRLPARWQDPVETMLREGIEATEMARRLAPGNEREQKRQKTSLQKRIELVKSWARRRLQRRDEIAASA